MKVHNFSAGPAILPAPVLQKASEAALEYNGIGLSILEISHRSPEFVAVLEEAVALVKELLQLPAGYEVLFLSGGASSQFFMTAMNLLNPTDRAGYVDTGSWSSSAIKEAKAFGQIEVLASSKDVNYNYIPKGYAIPEDLQYLHLTSNNTIFGTQYQEWPDTPVPIVCDMSSDIFSRPLPIDRFDLIYAGAQKNLGPAGTTLVIVKESILGKVERTIPTMLNYKTHIAKNSSYNTPPVYPIFVCKLTLEWIKARGGLSAMVERNQTKADLIYQAIDELPIFQGTVQKEDRSKMNACFVIEDDQLTKEFLKLCNEHGCSGIKGHRSVGGFRASIYNAMELSSVQALVDLMRDFAQKHG